MRKIYVALDWLSEGKMRGVFLFVLLLLGIGATAYVVLHPQECPEWSSGVPDYCEARP